MGTPTNESRQKVMKTLGEYGCYFLSLVKYAENLTGKRIDAVAAYISALEKGWTNGNALMLNPAAILSEMTGIGFGVKKTEADYKASSGEVEILMYESGNYTHFVLGDGIGGIAYDPLGENSFTVRNGRLSSKRILFRV